MGQSQTELRTRSRDVAFKLIYEREMGGDGGETSITELMELSPMELDMEYIAHAVNGVFDNLSEIDEAIAAKLRGWTIRRLSRVDLSIMRLAVCEMKYMDGIPNAASINEALELSHIYSTEKAAPLINGVLGAIGRDMEAK
ncbi:MAG: transcription antitermination factor NusB [Candidatus Fimadaptatus sp.]|jgi:N utilization substance protein B